MLTSRRGWLIVNQFLLIFVSTRCFQQTNVRQYLRLRNDELMSLPHSQGSAVQVKIGLQLLKIMNVDVKANIFETKLWMQIQWNDDRLIWLPGNFSNTEKVYLNQAEVWVPDITIYNDIGGSKLNPTQVLFEVNYDGLIKTNYLLHLITSCIMNITYFPFDQQICTIKVGSWTYNDLQVSVSNASSRVDLTYFEPRADWTLEDDKAVTNKVLYGCCNEKFSDVTFHFKMKRQSFYFICLSITMVIMIGAISFLSFLMPHGNDERIALCVFNLISMLLFFIIANTLFPSQEKTDAFFLDAIYILFSLTIGTLFYNIFTINIYYQGHWTGYGPPKLLGQLFFDFLAPIVFFHIEKTSSEMSARVRWHLIALVLDRYVMIVFVLFFVIFNSVFFVNISHEYRVDFN